MATRYLIFLSVFFVMQTDNADDAVSYLTEKIYTWLEAKKVCVLPGFQEKFKINSSSKQMGWIDASVKYTPWTEYLGCFELKLDEINLLYNIKTGKQLPVCLKSCRDHSYIGLKHNRCACLNNRRTYTNRSPCTQTEKEMCKGDKNSICAKNNPNGIFAVYRKDIVVGGTQKSPGECMATNLSSSGFNDLTIVSCTRKLIPICRAEKAMKSTRRKKWISSFLQCTNNTTARHDKKGETNMKGKYQWLPYLRQKIIVSPSEKKLDFCLAAYIKNDNIMTDVRNCLRRIPALCVKTTNIRTNSKTVVEGSKVLNTAYIITITLSTAAVLVILVLITFSVRRRVLSSNHQQSASFVRRYITLHRRQPNHRDIPERNEQTRTDSCHEYAEPEFPDNSNEDQRGSENYEDVFVLGSEQPSHDEIDPFYQSCSTDLHVNYDNQVRNELYYTDVSRDIVVQGDHCSYENFREQSEKRKYDNPSSDEEVVSVV